MFTLFKLRHVDLHILGRVHVYQIIGRTYCKYFTNLSNIANAIHSIFANFGFHEPSVDATTVSEIKTLVHSVLKYVVD